MIDLVLLSFAIDHVFVAASGCVDAKKNQKTLKIAFKKKLLKQPVFSVHKRQVEQNIHHAIVEDQV